MTNNFNAKAFVLEQKGERLSWTTGTWLNAIHNLSDKEIDLIDNAIYYWRTLEWATKAYQELKTTKWAETCTEYAYRFAQSMIQLEKV